MTVITEEFELEDAELVVDALREQAQWADVDVVGSERAKQLRLIANHLALEVAKARHPAVQRSDPQAGGYMQFDMSQDAAAHYQEFK